MKNVQPIFFYKVENYLCIANAISIVLYILQTFLFIKIFYKAILIKIFFFIILLLIFIHKLRERTELTTKKKLTIMRQSLK